MSKHSHAPHREIIERYCHVIGENTAIAKTLCGESVTMECLNFHNCEKSGGCKNEKFSHSRKSS